MPALPVATDASVVEAVPPLREGAANGTLGVLRLGRLLHHHQVPSGGGGGGGNAPAVGGDLVQRTAAAAAHWTHGFGGRGKEFTLKWKFEVVVAFWYRCRIMQNYPVCTPCRPRFPF